MKVITPPSPSRGLVPVTASRRAVYADASKQGIIHLTMLGPKLKMTPGNRPITVSEQFSLETDTPINAAIRAARKWHGQTLKPEHLSVIQEYRTDPKAKAAYSRVFIVRNDHPHERMVRSLRGVKDEHLNPFIERPSWYLWPI
jgi:hypothetical protein